ncbi:hypothetical protein AURDEDRAFT_78089 [Auricularia subglabra TFB-10046 SS5]|nr:hypothetical protein AURDEDRAFT_78089 [Auricularia subglabra TFB-10046 SS5]
MSSTPGATPFNHLFEPDAGLPALALSAHATSSAVGEPGDANTVVHEGWLLKKRRKKMQGFARRYFKLTQAGTLSYSFQPDGPIRDQISLRLPCSISSSTTRREIHIDSHVTFHVRALTQPDFDEWMAALRKFISVGAGTDTLKKMSLPRTLTFSLAMLANKAHTIAEDMHQTLTQLDEVYTTMKDEEHQKSRPSTQKTPSIHRSKKDKDHDRHSRDSSGKDGLFGMFRRSHHGNHAPPTPPDSSNDVAHLGVHRSPSSTTFTSTTLERMHAVIETLQAQHAALLEAIVPLTQVEAPPPAAHRLLTALTPHAEMYEEPIAYSPVNSRAMSIGTMRSNPNRMSVSSGSIWFDASEGAEEFVLEDEGDETQPFVVDDAESEASVEQHLGADLGDKRDDDREHDREAEKQEPEAPPPPPPVVRRTHLPAPASTEEVSLFAVLRKNVGKDLSTVAMPVTFNEPISVLQRLAEDVEYTDLLVKAVNAIDPVERMAFVAAFAVSGYASTQFRSSRKPFNPMLGETFEDIRTNFVAEKVSHNPPIMACHAEGDGWEYWATFGSKSKFWGKSYEITPVGTTHLRIGDDHYSWQRPSTFMRNIISGQRYLEHVGPVRIDDRTSGMSCQLEFKETGFFAGQPNVVAGTILTSHNKVEAKLEGKWHEQMALVTGPSHLRILWRASPFPPDALEYYGFTAYTVTLNEITPDIADRLPPTDSRFRPDQRALEEGDVLTAEEDKLRVEEMQRERRRRGADAKPRWFKKNGEEWVYGGGYWEQRERGWEDVPKLW